MREPGRAPLPRRMVDGHVRSRGGGRAAARPTAVVALLVLLAVPAAAQSSQRTLRIGVADSPPFAIAEGDGTWSGLGVELWQRIADSLSLRYELVPMRREEIGQALHDGRLDAGIGALPVTPSSTALHDFTQPYLSIGLGFAQHIRPPLRIGSIVTALFNAQLLTLIGTLMASIFVVGIVIALVERRQNSADFAGPLRDSVSTGVWWAAVTMTTVGYGDATPKTSIGRALALIWMFVGVVAVAVFTATVTSILTLAHLQGGIDRPSDLQRLRIGAIEGGAGGEYLRKHQFRFQPYPSDDAALRALEAGELDIAVANRATLRYLVTHNWQGELQVAPLVLDHENYAIGLPPHSPLRTEIDDALVRTINADSWDDVEVRYLGHQ